MSTDTEFKSDAEFGEEIIEVADIHYWADGYWHGETFIVSVPDMDLTATLTPERVGRAHRMLFQEGIARRLLPLIHPSNYEWMAEVDDYDATSGDWTIQFLIFGEVIFG